MEFLPREEIHTKERFNFAPMIDFLFLMMTLFATLAISRAALYDSEIDLATVKNSPSTKNTPKQSHHIHISIAPDGAYKWITEFHEYPMNSREKIQQELTNQYEIGALHQDKTCTSVLLHIDKKAPWHTVSDLIFAIREIGFIAHPVYETVD